MFFFLLMDRADFLERTLQDQPEPDEDAECPICAERLPVYTAKCCRMQACHACWWKAFTRKRQCMQCRADLASFEEWETVRVPADEDEDAEDMRALQQAMYAHEVVHQGRLLAVTRAWMMTELVENLIIHANPDFIEEMRSWRQWLEAQFTPEQLQSLVRIHQHTLLAMVDAEESKHMDFMTAFNRLVVRLISTGGCLMLRGEWLASGARDPASEAAAPTDQPPSSPPSRSPEPLPNASAAPILRSRPSRLVPLATEESGVISLLPPSRQITAWAEDPSRAQAAVAALPESDARRLLTETFQMFVSGIHASRANESAPSSGDTSPPPSLPRTTDQDSPNTPEP